jgi:hypothetical protein
MRQIVASRTNLQKKYLCCRRENSSGFPDEVSCDYKITARCLLLGGVLIEFSLQGSSVNAKFLGCG